MDITVVLPTVNECENVSTLLPRLRSIFAREKLSYEILVIDGNSTDGTREVAASLGARVMPERRRGYAGALTTGLAEAQGDYILTLDADLSHEPEFVPRMWRARTRGDIVIASRYTRGGVAYSGFFRRKLSDFLNFALRRALSIPVGDVSSGFRLYRREVAQQDLDNIESQNFEIQEEILVKAYAKGFSITEVPFVYFPRGSGQLACARAALRHRSLHLGDQAMEDPQLARFRGLRRARVLQHHPAFSATGSAAATPSCCYGRAATSACSTPDAAPASSSRASTTRSEWISCFPSCASCAAMGYRSRKDPPSRFHLRMTASIA